MLRWLIGVFRLGIGMGWSLGWHGGGCWLSGADGEQISDSFLAAHFVCAHLLDRSLYIVKSTKFSNTPPRKAEDVEGRDQKQPLYEKIKGFATEHGSLYLFHLHDYQGPVIPTLLS
jgi:hypothetical protein